MIYPSLAVSSTGARATTNTLPSFLAIDNLQWCLVLVGTPCSVARNDDTVFVPRSQFAIATIVLLPPGFVVVVVVVAVVVWDHHYHRNRSCNRGLQCRW